MRKLKILSSSILFLLSSAAIASSQNSTVAVAPMSFRGLMPVIEVKLNGQGPFAFAIDTGAGMQADVDTAVAARLKLTSGGRVLNGDPSGENDRVVETATIASVSFGGAEFHNVLAVV